jgi:myosin tail region-interacting protein MTI1
MRSFSVLLFLSLCTARLVAQNVQEEKLPDVNASIITFCESSKGKKIGKGECWDLAKAALDNAGAEWTAPYEFGTKIGKKDPVLPGDIVQLENVKIVSDNMTWTYPHHTAIIYKVVAPGKYIIAEQNSNNKRYVIFSDFDLNNLKKGKVSIFRPVK